MFVVIEGRRARKLEKQERFIRVERAVFIGIFITLALFMVTGVLGFFDFVSRFKEPLDKIILFLPVIISILASIAVADLIREEVEGSAKTNLLKAFLLASGAVFLIAVAFVVIPALFPVEFRIIIFLALMLAVAEAFSRIIKQAEKARPLGGELRKEVEELCRRTGVDVDGIYLIEDEGINALVTGAKGKTIFVTKGAIEHLERDELLAIIAHELGHVKKRHMLKGYALSILHIVPMTILLKIGDRLPEAVLTIYIVLSFVILVAGLLYRLARFNLKCELEADEFAAELVGADA
ncbi:hypothetical protein A3L04_03620 [Thermococcus chitonophagus]|uniref:Peptidase M48 domain-containing protein n=1 Tax=Thermococcus chitonophagus TaxID=54262 RepID=A0A2Z2N9N1_9EURY|nr:hypothetical protein A3L04_03620 [Thermococcus chitonophagus]